MEISFYEDPGCSWCWAFQPVSTVFAFEFRHAVKARLVMGGLRDRPAADADFIVQQWKKAEAVSGMPFDCSIWKRHVLSTTFLACRAVKAAGMIEEASGRRLLRRLREALYVEGVPIDSTENILLLADEVGVNTEILSENIASGRAEALFARDRAEASQFGFGFPTIVIRDGHQDGPIVLQGAVPYTDILHALASVGITQKHRRRFRDCPEHWESLFKIHSRLTLAEIQAVTSMDKTRLVARLAALGFAHTGPFFHPPRPKEAESAARPAARPCCDPTSRLDPSRDPQPRPEDTPPRDGDAPPHDGDAGAERTADPVPAAAAPPADPPPLEPLDEGLPP